MTIDNKAIDLCKYRFSQSEETINTAQILYEAGKYRDAINRSYYAAFYSIKAFLALEEFDAKSHKTVIAYFNKNYVATGIFSRDVGKFLGQMQTIRENSDYSDFFIASQKDAEDQITKADIIIKAIKEYLMKNHIIE